MRKVKITTPENIEIEYTLADIGSRTAAAIFDLLIQLVLYIFIGIILYQINKRFKYFWLDYMGWILGVTILVVFIILYGYYIISEMKMNGRTIGKKIMKLRAIRNNGQPITLKHSAIRNLFRVFLDMYGIGIILMFFSKENKRLGDMTASTIVVIEDSNTEPISLEGLQKVKEHYEMYLSDEENELLREYFQRKITMEDCSQLRFMLTHHLEKKFEELGNLDEWRTFIKSL